MLLFSRKIRLIFCLKKKKDTKTIELIRVLDITE